MNRRDYHTGADLNLNKPHFDTDRESPVYAAADGVVVYAQSDTPWGKRNAIVCIMHELPNGMSVWTRYAHIINLLVKDTDIVKRGQQIAQIGNGGGRYPYHLHFDVAWIDLGARPGDWAGADYGRCVRSYADPLRFIQESRR
jgi:murein DD-endopeptidase MepM/ murein hydrolase activator NlpD